MHPQQVTSSVAARFASALALTSAGAHIFRGLLDRIFYNNWGTDFVLRVTLSTIILYIAWFLFTLTALKINARILGRRDNEIRISRQEHGGNFLQVWHAVAVAPVAALLLAATAWFAITANDEIFFSRLLPWIGPLIWFQDVGFHVASRLFPCRMEGSNLGCEAYKWLPAFLLSNAAAYFPFVLLGTFVYFRSAQAKATAETFLRGLIKWGTLLAGTGLALRLTVYRLVPEASFPAHDWDIPRFMWAAADQVTGVLCLMLLLVVPFCIRRLVNLILKERSVLDSLVELTWLAAFASVAITLGYQYRF